MTPIEKHIVAAVEFAENMYVNYTIHNMVLPTINQLDEVRAKKNVDAATMAELKLKEELVFNAIPWLSVGETQTFQTAKLRSYWFNVPDEPFILVKQVNFNSFKANRIINQKGTSEEDAAKTAIPSGYFFNMENK